MAKFLKFLILINFMNVEVILCLSLSKLQKRNVSEDDEDLDMMLHSEEYGKMHLFYEEFIKSLDNSENTKNGTLKLGSENHTESSPYGYKEIAKILLSKFANGTLIEGRSSTPKSAKIIDKTRGIKWYKSYLKKFLLERNNTNNANNSFQIWKNKVFKTTTVETTQYTNTRTPIHVTNSVLEHKTMREILMKHKAHYVNVIRNDFIHFNKSKDYAVVELENENREHTELSFVAQVPYSSFSKKFEVRTVMFFSIIFFAYLIK